MNKVFWIILISSIWVTSTMAKTKKIEADAFRQSQKLLKLAATELVESIKTSNHFMLSDYPERKKILLNILPYENLVKFPGKDNIYKDGVLLSMGHQIDPNLIMIYKPFFVTYAGASDSEFEKKAVEVKKDLLMEASLTWGFNEKEAETFANNVLQIKNPTSNKLRPEHSVFVKPDYCSCLNGKRDILNQCDSFCKSTYYDSPTLYGSVILGEKIVTDKALGSLYGWCTADISGTSPKCVLELTNGLSKEYIDISIPQGSNNFTANINTLKINVTYVARIVEVGSETNNASSDSFQIRRVPPPQSSRIFSGPLKISPISQYACITKLGQFDPASKSAYFDLMAKNHYYFEPRQKPPVGPPNDFINCYDRDLYGPVDRITFPRLELIPKALSLWDMTDIRFSDTNGDGQRDINNLIDAEMEQIYGVIVSTDYFAPLKLPTSPSISTSGSQGTNEPVMTTLGYYMKVFIDPYTGVGKCPTQEDYFGPDITFQALRNAVGVDTEAVYVGARERETLVNPDGTTTEIPPDLILIRESELKKIWFYFENNLVVKPDYVTSTQQTVYFYYPPEPGYKDPYIRKSYQTLYAIRDRSALGAAIAPADGASSEIQGLPTGDKRFGCIPKASNAEDPENINKPQINNSNSENTNPVPESPATSIPGPQQVPYSSVEEFSTPNKLLYWYTNKPGNPLTISSNIKDLTYIRGSILNDYLKAIDPTTGNPNWQKTYCLVISYIHEGSKQQLRARAFPIAIGNQKDNTIEKLLRIDWSLAAKNQDVCKGNLPTYNHLASEVSTTAEAAFTPLDLCPDCSGLIQSTNISLYFENILPDGRPGELSIANKVPIGQFDPAVLMTKVDFTKTIGECTQSYCIDQGSDCCVEGKCVKDKTERSGASQNPEYYQAKKDVALHPSLYLNYPKIFNVCPIPSDRWRDSTTQHEDSSTYEIEAQLRFSIQRAQFFCQEEGKQQNPNLELFCNNKFLCSNLWINSESSFKGNCADLDGKDGSQRYKENKINISKICGCRAKGYPNSPEDKRCPDFIFKAIRNENGYITQILCSIDPKAASDHNNGNL